MKQPLPRLELLDPTSPFDEAVIAINGCEEKTITIDCVGARELAEEIVLLVNSQRELGVVFPVARS